MASLVVRSTFDRLPYGCLLFMYRLPISDFRVPKNSLNRVRLTANRVPNDPRNRFRYETAICYTLCAPRAYFRVYRYCLFGRLFGAIAIAVNER